MGNLLFKLRVVSFICFSLITILWPFAVFANQINVDNWSIEVIAQRASDSVPAYSRPNDSEKSGSIIGVSKNQYIEGLSSIVLIKREDGEAFGFVAGNLSSPGNNLIIVEIKVHNLGKESRSFLLGDFKLVSADGVNLPYAALAKSKLFKMLWTESYQKKFMVKSDSVKITFILFSVIQDFAL